MVYNLKRDKIDERDFKFQDKIAAKIEVPSCIDLSSTTPPIFDQGNLGSCSANSSTRGLMNASKDKTAVLSRLYQYYKTREIEDTVGEDSGCTNRDAVKSTNKNGICLENLMPYDINKFTQSPSNEAIKEALNHKSTSYYSLKNLDDVFQSLARGIPVVIGMDVFDSFESDAVAHNGIMHMPTKREKNLGGHSVLIEGKKDSVLCGGTKQSFWDWILSLLGVKESYRSKSKGYLKIANSWGVNWGDRGYFYMPYEYFEKYTFDYWCIL